MQRSVARLGLRLMGQCLTMVTSRPLETGAIRPARQQQQSARHNCASTAQQEGEACARRHRGEEYPPQEPAATQALGVPSQPPPLAVAGVTSSMPLPAQQAPSQNDSAFVAHGDHSSTALPTHGPPPTPSNQQLDEIVYTGSIQQQYQQQQQQRFGLPAQLHGRNVHDVPTPYYFQAPPGYPQAAQHRQPAPGPARIGGQNPCPGGYTGTVSSHGGSSGLPSLADTSTALVTQGVGLQGSIGIRCTTRHGSAPGIPLEGAAASPGVTQLHDRTFAFHPCYSACAGVAADAAAQDTAPHTTPDSGDHSAAASCEVVRTAEPELLEVTAPTAGPAHERSHPAPAPAGPPAPASMTPGATGVSARPLPATVTAGPAPAAAPIPATAAAPAASAAPAPPANPAPAPGPTPDAAAAPDRAPPPGPAQAPTSATGPAPGLAPVPTPGPVPVPGPAPARAPAPPAAAAASFAPGPAPDSGPGDAYVSKPLKLSPPNNPSTQASWAAPAQGGIATHGAPLEERGVNDLGRAGPFALETPSPPPSHATAAAAAPPPTPSRSMLDAALRLQHQRQQGQHEEPRAVTRPPPPPPPSQQQQPSPTPLQQQQDLSPPPLQQQQQQPSPPPPPQRQQQQRRQLPHQNDVACSAAPVASPSAVTPSPSVPAIVLPPCPVHRPGHLAPVATAAPPPTVAPSIAAGTPAAVVDPAPAVCDSSAAYGNSAAPTRNEAGMQAQHAQLFPPMAAHALAGAGGSQGTYSHAGEAAEAALSTAAAPAPAVVPSPAPQNTGSGSVAAIRSTGAASSAGAPQANTNSVLSSQVGTLAPAAAYATQQQCCYRHNAPAPLAGDPAFVGFRQRQLDYERAQALAVPQHHQPQEEQLPPVAPPLARLVTEQQAEGAEPLGHFQHQQQQQQQRVQGQEQVQLHSGMPSRAPPAGGTCGPEVASAAAPTTASLGWLADKASARPCHAGPDPQTEVPPVARAEKPGGGASAAATVAAAAVAAAAVGTAAAVAVAERSTGQPEGGAVETDARGGRGVECASGAQQPPAGQGRSALSLSQAASELPTKRSNTAQPQPQPQLASTGTAAPVDTACSYGPHPGSGAAGPAESHITHAHADGPQPPLQLQPQQHEAAAPGRRRIAVAIADELARAGKPSTGVKYTDGTPASRYGRLHEKQQQPQQHTPLPLQQPEPSQSQHALPDGCGSVAGGQLRASRTPSPAGSRASSTPGFDRAQQTFSPLGWARLLYDTARSVFSPAAPPRATALEGGYSSTRAAAGLAVEWGATAGALSSAKEDDQCALRRGAAGGSVGSVDGWQVLQSHHGTEPQEQQRPGPYADAGAGDAAAAHLSCSQGMEPSGHQEQEQGEAAPQPAVLQPHASGFRSMPRCECVTTAAAQGRGALTESGTGFRFASGAGTQVHPHTGAEHQLHAAQAALQMQKGILTEQQARLSDQQKQLRELNADLGIVTRQRDAEARWAKGLQAQLEEATQRAAARAREVSRLSEEVTFLQADLEAAKKAHKGTKSSLAQLGRAVDALQARVDAAEEELNVERERHSELERERTDLEIELLQLKESLAQQQLQGHHHNAHHHHHHNHHAPHPPVLPLSGRRLLPDADHEVGFGADEVRHALYGMGKKLRRQAQQLVKEVPGLQENVWKSAQKLLPYGVYLADADAARPDLIARCLAAWLATRLQPAWYDPLSYILPEGGDLMGLPYGGDGGGLDEQEANTLQLLYGHAARRWCDVAAAAAGAATGSFTATARDARPLEAPAHNTADMLRGAVGNLAAQLLRPLQLDNQQQQEQLVASLHRLAFDALRLGLLVRASHPLLRVWVTPLPHSGQGPQLLHDNLHEELSSVGVLRSPPPAGSQGDEQQQQQQQQQQEPVSNDWESGNTGSSTDPPRVVFTVTPGAYYAAAGSAASGGASWPQPGGSRVLVKEGVITWVWAKQSPRQDARVQHVSSAALDGGGGGQQGPGRGGGGWVQGGASGGPPPAPPTPAREVPAAGGAAGGTGLAVAADGDDGVGLQEVAETAGAAANGLEKEDGAVAVAACQMPPASAPGAQGQWVGDGGGVAAGGGRGMGGPGDGHVTERTTEARRAGSNEPPAGGEIDERKESGGPRMEDTGCGGSSSSGSSSHDGGHGGADAIGSRGSGTFAVRRDVGEPVTTAPGGSSWAAGPPPGLAGSHAPCRGGVDAAGGSGPAGTVGGTTIIATQVQQAAPVAEAAAGPADGRPGLSPSASGGGGSTNCSPAAATRTWAAVAASPNLTTPPAAPPSSTNGVPRKGAGCGNGSCVSIAAPTQDRSTPRAPVDGKGAYQQKQQQQKQQQQKQQRSVGGGTGGYAGNSNSGRGRGPS